MTSATLDTNVYISALEFGGVGARILGMGRFGRLRIDISPAILDEIVTVLREDFLSEGYRIHFARQELANMGNLVTPTTTLAVIVDPDDNRILECAIEAKSDFIVSADKHLLDLGEYSGIPILRPHEFLAL